MRKRIRTQLEFHDFAGRALAAFDVIGRPARIGRPQPLAFPAAVRIVDSPVEALGVEAHWIRHAQGDELSIHQPLERIRHVAGCEGNILAEPEGIELIDPGLITGLHRTRFVHAFELRTGELVQGPAFRTMAPGGIRAVERTLAFLAVEARKMPAGERNPEHAVAVDIPAARAESI